MSATDRLPAEHADSPPERGRRPGELTLRELGRWLWRQLTSMRTALVLLLLLALAAIPGSVIPQEGVDRLATQRWQDANPGLTPVYERLGLFSVYDSVWFSAIYLMLMVSLVGCIVPRTLVYARALRAAPPRAPARLTRLPDHASYSTAEEPAVVLRRAVRVLRKRGFRVVEPTEEGQPDAVAAERGKLREAGNLVFHLALLVVLVGFALGSLFGYQGGVIVLVGGGFSNNLTQYDDFDPGALYDAGTMEPFSFTIDDFDVEWIERGRSQGMPRKFVSGITYRTTPDAEPRHYDLRVNHPLGIGGTDIFLIGHGYAPVVTVRDGRGDVVATGPVVFLPMNPDLQSFGVIKAPDAQPRGIGLEGLFYPTYLMVDGDPVNVMGDDRNPTLSMQVWSGDLGVESGAPQSVYVLDKSKAEQLKKEPGSRQPLRIDLQQGMTRDLPDGLGSVTFEGVQEWNRIQVSRTPGKWVALVGVILALLGLMGSLFIRPRRAWVRVRRAGQGTLVEVAVLDRSGGAEVGPEVGAIVSALQDPDTEAATDTGTDTDSPTEADDPEETRE